MDITNEIKYATKQNHIWNPDKLQEIIELLDNKSVNTVNKTEENCSQIIILEELSGYICKDYPLMFIISKYYPLVSEYLKNYPYLTIIEVTSLANKELHIDRSVSLSLFYFETQYFISATDFYEVTNSI